MPVIRNRFQLILQNHFVVNYEEFVSPVRVSNNKTLLQPLQFPNQVCVDFSG